MPCGQDGPLRQDETETEFVIRTGWIYGADAFFFIGLVYAVVVAIVDLSDGDFTGANVAAFLIDLGVYGGFLLTNTLLLRAMRFRRALQTKCFVAGTVAFALVCFVLLIITIVNVAIGFGQSGERDYATVVCEWVFRGVLVLFYVAMAHTYTDLWSAYDGWAPQPLKEAKVDEPVGVRPAPEGGAPASRCEFAGMVLLAGFASVLVSTLLVVMFIVDPSAFWDATTL